MCRSSLAKYRLVELARCKRPLPSARSIFSFPIFRSRAPPRTLSFPFSQPVPSDIKYSWRAAAVRARAGRATCPWVFIDLIPPSPLDSTLSDFPRQELGTWKPDASQVICTALPRADSTPARPTAMTRSKSPTPKSHPCALLATGPRICAPARGARSAGAGPSCMPRPVRATRAECSAATPPRQGRNLRPQVSQRAAAFCPRQLRGLREANYSDQRSRPRASGWVAIALDTSGAVGRSGDRAFGPDTIQAH